MKLSDLFDATGEPFSYYPGLVTKFDISVNACVFLCFIGWRTIPGDDGWRAFNVADIVKKTGLTEREQSTARNQLRDKGLIDDKYARLEHKLLIRLAGDKKGVQTDQSENGQPRFPQMANRQSSGSSIDKEADKEGDREKIAPSLVNAYWNGKGNLPKTQRLAHTRLKSLEARLKEPFFNENWKTIVDRISASPFCCGKNDRGWKADFDWFIKPDTGARVMEGKYDQKNGAGTPLSELKLRRDTLEKRVRELEDNVQYDPKLGPELKLRRAELRKVEDEILDATKG